MTEYWVSHSKHWCELCKCWLNDTPASRAHHERGSGHKLAVQRKLREMRIKGEIQKKETERTEQQLEKIDKAAEEAYREDVRRLVRSCALPERLP
jgi:WW domain-binding protein 4